MIKHGVTFVTKIIKPWKWNINKNVTISVLLFAVRVGNCHDILENMENIKNIVYFRYVWPIPDTYFIIKIYGKL